MEYRNLLLDEIDLSLFRAFSRRQVVERCWRKSEGEWVIRDIPFVDDWTRAEYREVVEQLRVCAASGGLVAGAFENGALKGFVSVEAEPIGSRGQYMDLSVIMVSEEARGRGIGRELFSLAKAYARGRGAEKLYISAHSSVETQAFYRSMGCVEALEYSAYHVEKEPCDCQLECEVGRGLAPAE